jgi:anthranilate synthase component 1
MPTEPMLVSLLSDVETPVSLFYKLGRKQPVAFLFESADGDKRVARFSFMGVSPVLSIRLKDGLAEITHHLDGTEQQVPFTDPMQLLKELHTQTFPHGVQRPDRLGDVPFIGGWVGYLGYGMTRYFEQVPQQAADPLDVPDAYLALYDTVIIFDHLYRRIHFLSARTRSEAEALWTQIRSDIQDRAPACAPAMLPMFYQDDMSDEALFDGVQTSVTKEQYLQGVLKTKEYITEGQVFQLVLAQRFSMPVTCEPLDVYRMVTAINPSPYAYFLKFPEFAYLGSSPETFVSSQDGQVVLRALAGTRPRGQSPEEDVQLSTELRADAKELAEHRMLVDLGRNDLGRICEAGTVSTGEIAQVLRYSHVMHLSTEITGHLREGKTGYEVVKSCFPRGTVSGAPKIRAMELLSQLEPERRGVYSGMVGYFDHAGNTDGAIAIRSALIKGGMAHVHAGAGIVYNSNPEAEYEETRNKSKSILKAIKIAQKMAQEQKADKERTPSDVTVHA